MKKINILFFIIITSIIVWIGCGKSPSEPPEVVGGFEIFVYLDSAWVDTGGIEHDSCLAPNFDCIIDDGAPIHSDTVPAIFENLMPGVHNLYLSYNDYNTTIIDTVTAGAIKTLEPKLSKLAPDFDLPGLHYNTSTSAVIYDSVHLSDCAGKVVVIFFFGASWGECIGREIPDIETEIHQYFSPDSVVCLAMADNFTSPAFLANYCQGLTPFNPTLITFDLLYNAGQTIISYSFTASSTWVIIDQEGRIVFRETDTAPEMIDEIKTKIEELLSP